MSAHPPSHCPPSTRQAAHPAGHHDTISTSTHPVVHLPRQSAPLTCPSPGKSPTEPPVCPSTYFHPRPTYPTTHPPTYSKASTHCPPLQTHTHPSILHTLLSGHSGQALCPPGVQIWKGPHTCSGGAPTDQPRTPRVTKVDTLSPAGGHSALTWRMAWCEVTELRAPQASGRCSGIHARCVRALSFPGGADRSELATHKCLSHAGSRRPPEEERAVEGVGGGSL